MVRRLHRFPLTRQPDYTVNWQKHLESRTVTPEQAVARVKSGDRVAICRGREPQALGSALARRAPELKRVRVWLPQPGRDFGWYADNSLGESFEVSIGVATTLARKGVNGGWIQFGINSDVTDSDPALGGNPGYGSDVYMVEISEPDAHGFCSFGTSVWDKPMALRTAKLVLGEIVPRMIRTYGENSCHITEIDYFVKAETTSGWNISRTPKYEMPPLAKRFAELIKGLVHSGDTVQIGLGIITEWLPRAGVFDERVDLGLFTELTPRYTTELVQGGVITNKRKSIHQGKSISSAAGGSSKDLAFVNENPLFELYSVEYVVNPLTIAQHENMMAINQGMAIDLTGQSTAESLGTFQYSGAGGQPAFVMGAMMAPGGRSVLVLPSTASNGQQSRIVSVLPEGTTVTVPRYYADIVVTEYGIANLRWKTVRERAEALIGIAHPDFRKELEQHARARFWPH